MLKSEVRRIENLPAIDGLDDQVNKPVNEVNV